MKLIIPFFFITLSLSSSFGQKILDHRLDGSEIGKPLGEYLLQIEKSTNSRVFFIDQWFKDIKIEQGYEGLTLSEALKKILQGTDITYATFYDYVVVFIKDPDRTLEKMKFKQSVKAEGKIVQAKSIGRKEKSKPGERVVLRGLVKDGKNLEPLAGAIVQVKDGESVITKNDGTFKLNLSIGEHYIVFQYSNYEEKIVYLEIYENGEILEELMETPKVLDEVIVTGRQSSNVTSNVGQIDLKMAQLRKLPTFLGEVDIIKNIMIVPGVTSVGEMSSGFNVRGVG